jgi:hypothetical protein
VTALPSHRMTTKLRTNVLIVMIVPTASPMPTGVVGFWRGFQGSAGIPVTQRGFSPGVFGILRAAAGRGSRP